VRESGQYEGRPVRGTDQGSTRHHTADTYYHYLPFRKATLPRSNPSIRALPVMAGIATAPKFRKASGSASGVGAPRVMAAKLARVIRAT